MEKFNKWLDENYKLLAGALIGTAASIILGGPLEALWVFGLFVAGIYYLYRRSKKIAQ